MWALLSSLDWTLINSFASWLSALGTIAAVIVALYLASRDRNIHLRVNAGIRILYTEGQSPSERIDCLSISVTNIGHRTARIEGLLWYIKPLRISPFRRHSSYFYMITPRNVYSSSMPVELRDGQTAIYIVPLTEYQATNANNPMYVGRFPKLAVRSTRIVVNTSTGKLFSSKIEQELQDWFLNAGLFCRANSEAEEGNGEMPVSGCKS